MPLYGYARVSTFEQDLGIQRAALKAAGCKVQGLRMRSSELNQAARH